MPRSVENINHPRQRHDGGQGDVLDLVHTVMHLYRAQQFRTLREGEGLTHMESKVLGFFARHPGATLSELVAHAGRDKGQLARLVGGLRERGLLQAQADPRDARSVQLQLTALGESAAQAIRRQSRRVSSRATQGLSDAERASLAALLEKVRANLEAAQEEP